MLAALVPDAHATDNLASDHPHWHSPVTVHASLSLMPSWRRLIDDAVEEWAEETPAPFIYWVPRIDSTDHRGPEHIMWAGGIPESQQDVCSPIGATACTFGTFTADGDVRHFVDVDTVFNTAFQQFTEQQWFSCVGPMPDLRVGSITLLQDYELLPVGPDFLTVVLHELGLWGGLRETEADRFALMYQWYNGCKQSLRTHDAASMFHNYRRAGH